MYYFYLFGCFDLVVAGRILIFAACRIFSCSMQMLKMYQGSSSLSRYQTQAPLNWSMES